MAVRVWLSHGQKVVTAERPAVEGAVVLVHLAHAVAVLGRQVKF